MSKLAWFARGKRNCPAAWKLTRLASSGARDPEIEQHLASCARCAARNDGLTAIVAEARRLPPPPGMSEESRAAISARLLAARAPEAPAAKVPARRTLLLTLGLAGGFAAALVVAERGRTPAPVRLAAPHATPAPPASQMPQASPAPPALSRASIRAIGDARFARVQPPPDEIVRLDDGRIELDVVPLAPGERFRVTTDGGEVEVRGTSFEVLAADRRLAAVSVSRGRVEVRSGGGGLAVLDAGDRWEQAAAPPVRALEEAEGAPRRPPAGNIEAAPVRRQVANVDAVPARRSPLAKPAAGLRPSPAESALFDSGWSSLRAGNAREAAAKFAELERQAQGRAIQEDALYWRAVATARCKESATAGRLFREFLAKFPASARRGEAAVALGWILFDAGDSDEARKAFEHAASDPAASVRASAAEGLRRTSRP